MSSRPQQESGESGAPTAQLPPYVSPPQAGTTAGGAGEPPMADGPEAAGAAREAAGDDGAPTRPLPVTVPAAAVPPVAVPSGAVPPVAAPSGAVPPVAVSSAGAPPVALPSDPAAAFGWQTHYDEMYERKELVTAIDPVLVDPVTEEGGSGAGRVSALGRGQGRRRAKASPGRRRAVITAAGVLGVGAVVAVVAGLSGSSGNDGRSNTPVTTDDHATDPGSPFGEDGIPGDVTASRSASASPAPSVSAPSSPTAAASASAAPTSKAPTTPAPTPTSAKPTPQASPTATRTPSASPTSTLGHGHGHKFSWWG